MQRLIEGVSFDKDSDQFRFDFSSDNSEDFVRLVSDGPYELKEYSPCTYFGYVFEKNTPKDIKAKFINAIKFPDNEKNISKEDLTRFIRNAVYQLDQKVSLSKYDCIVYPQSSSKLNSWLIEEIGNISLSDKFLKFELLKEVPKNIEFNYELFERHLDKENLNSLARKNALKSVEFLMNDIHNLDYLRIGKSVKPKYRKYLRNFFRFQNDFDKEAFQKLQSKNVLVLDDVSTTMATLQYVLNAMRILNDTNQITLFCILGNKER